LGAHPKTVFQQANEGIRLINAKTSTEALNGEGRILYGELDPVVTVELCDDLRKRNGSKLQPPILPRQHTLNLRRRY
jgi:hypothetical protein